MSRSFATLAAKCGLAAVLCGATACDEQIPTEAIAREAIVPGKPTRPLRGVCSLEAGNFTPNVDNLYFPLPVGRRTTLQGVAPDGTRLLVDTEVLAATENIAGFATRVVEALEFEDGALIERVHDFYAQAPDGTVCYFGEDVDEIENGQVVGHTGTWRAGQGNAQPGTQMPATPQPCTSFAQERAPGVAQDQSQVVAVGVPVSVPAGDFADAAFLLDWNPLEGETIVQGEHKAYAPGIGLVIDDTVELVSFQ